MLNSIVVVVLFPFPFFFTFSDFFFTCLVCGISSTDILLLFV